MRQWTRNKARNIGLALGGGGARGLAHIGVLKVLDRENIPIRIIAGTSIGALVGAAFASGILPEDMEKRVESYLQSEKFQNSAIKAIENARAKGDLSLGRRASRPMPFQDAFHTAFSPVSQPYGYFGTMYFEDVGNLRSSLSFHAKNNRMESSCNPICPITERLFVEYGQFLNFFGSSMNFDRSHDHGTSSV